MIICNGSPKTGTHLLLKAVYLFGGEAYLAKHEHQPYIGAIEGKHIHITRNPRNVLISYIRYFSESDFSEENIIRHMPIVINEMSSYTGWTKDKNTLNIKFEELLTDEKELDKISKFLNLPKAGDHFRAIWGGTSTFTNSLSNWREYFTDAIMSEWVLAGGLALEQSLEYKPEKEVKKIRKAKK